MPAEMTVWSYVTQWFGYVGWCASASDPACRPFVGFLALFGASAGMLSLMVIGLVGMLNAWEHDISAARESAAEHRRVRAIREKLGRADAPLGVVAGGAYAGHAEPLLSGAAALAMTTDPMSAGRPVAVPLQRTS